MLWYVIFAIVLATGLGPLEPLLADPSVDEVMVNGPRDVYVERRGRLERVGVEFAGEGELMHAIERVLAPLGRRVDEASPLCDARLPEGFCRNGACCGGLVAALLRLNPSERVLVIGGTQDGGTGPGLGLQPLGRDA